MKRICAWVTLLSLAGLFGLLPASYAEETSEPEPFTLSLEFYDAIQAEEFLIDGGVPPGTLKKLDPLRLKKGEDVAVAIRYSGLDDAIDNQGIRCLSVALCYDASCFELSGFTIPEEDGTAVKWEGPAKTFSEYWIPSALQYCYTGDASVQKIKTEVATVAEGDPDAEEGQSEERDIRRIYLQYVAESYREPSDILSDDSGYLGGFTFQVLRDFSADENVKFVWDDFAVGLYSSSSLEESLSLRLADAATTDHFDAPKDVHVATGDGGDDPGPEGYTITGEIVSYNAKNPVTYELYKMGDDGQYETTAAYAGTAVEKVTSGLTSGQQTQRLQIPGIASGTYRLVLNKRTHLRFTISNIEVKDSDVELDKIGAVGTIKLIAGDLDEDGMVNPSDTNKVFDPNAVGKHTNEVSEEIAFADADGDGLINPSDTNVIFDEAHINKKNTDADLNIVL